MTTVTGLVRLSLAEATGRQVDLAVPAQLAVVELLPDIAGALGLHVSLDSGPAGGPAGGPDRGPARDLLWRGLQLVGVTGQPLRSDLSLAEQGVADGAILTVVDGPGPAVPDSDDAAEVMAESVEESCLAWHPTLARPASLAASVVLLCCGAIGLWRAGSVVPSPLGPTQAGIAASAVTVLLVAAVFGLVRRRDLLTALLAGWAAVGYATAAGLLLGGLPLAGGLAFVTGVAVARVVGARGLLVLPAAAAGGIAGLLGLVDRTSGLDPSFVAVVALAGVIVGAGANPRLALALASDDVGRAHDVLRALMVTTGLLGLVLIPAVVGTGPWGVLLATVSCLLAALRARRHHSAAEVLLGFGFAAAGLVLVMAAVALTLPGWSGYLGLAAAGAGLALSLTMTGETSSLRAALVLEQAEGVLVVAVLPLVVLSTDVIGLVQGLSLH